MSILSTIKYPISDPPTLEEIEALPDTIYKDWLAFMGFHFTVSRHTTYTLIKSKFYMIPEYRNELKRLIYMYDEDA